MGDIMEEKSDGDMNQTSAKQPSVSISQFLQQNYKKLPWFEKFCFDYGSVFVGSNALACGLMAHNLFRRTLKVRKYYLLSCLPVTAVPFFFTTLYHEMLVTQPLIEGSLNCSSCAVVRGSYVGMIMGGVAPVVLAGSINLLMVPVYLRTQMKENILREMISFTKPVFSRLKYFLLFEAVASVVITSNQFGTITKLLQMSPDSKTQEELIE
ncbi:unnamed protein product [Staurois parvus]|uniref:Transmembrane protein 126A n=1 Tax=Staurois parvus TaxID=386267 RepID=A0ABN9APV2_9NEOB|nr:unnamed protein product [Staurois parvus]